MNEKSKSVLLLGDFRYTPVFGRSLAAKGLRVAVAHSSEPDYASRSRFTDRTLLTSFENSTVFGAWLKETVAQDPSIATVMALGDLQAMLLAECAPMLEGNVACVTSSEASIRTCTEKIKMCELAAAHDVPQAPFLVAETLGDAIAGVAEIGYPCVIKPAESLAAFREKAVILERAADLRRLDRYDPALVGPFLVQQFVSGYRYNVQFLARDGQLVERLVTRTTRTDRHDDTGYTVESVTVETSEMMDRSTRALVGALNYSGFGCLQFFGRSGTKDISFLEINPRLGGAFAISEKCGVDFPGLAADLWVFDRPAPTKLSDYPAGKRMVWTGGDLLGIRTSLARGDIDKREAAQWLWRAGKAFVRADAHPTLTRRDPLLAVRYYGRAFDKYQPWRRSGR